MGWWVIPVRLPALEVHIQADPRLAFEVLAAFGAKQGDDASSRVLQDEGDKKLVEFHSSTRGFFGRTKHYKTVEWVTLDPPNEVLFEGIEGPLDHMEDRLSLSEQDGCTCFRYESTVGVKGWLGGWLVTQTYIRWVLGKFMREHTESLKQAIEQRAARSKVYPTPACAHD